VDDPEVDDPEVDDPEVDDPEVDDPEVEEVPPDVSELVGTEGNVPDCENTNPLDCRTSLEKEGRDGSLFTFFLNFIPLKL
jgi:hypothetical protein